MTVSDDTKFLFDIEFGLGAWAWGDRIFWNYGQTHTDDDIKNAFESSLDAGISFLDTAEVYGQGRSETLIGELLKTTKKPTVVATKFMPFPWRIRKSSLDQGAQTQPRSSWTPICGSIPNTLALSAVSCGTLGRSFG